MRYIILFVAITVGFACSNDFELNAPAKETPVVYGLLSRADEVHFLRIEKAFIDQQTSALELAQRPEALYFEGIEVELVRERDQASFILDEVDGSQIGLERASGIFATTPNVLYKIDQQILNLQEEEVVRLNIRRPSTDELLATAVTPIVGDLRLNRPLTGSQKPALRIPEDDNLTLVWGATESAKLFDVTMLIHYQEFEANNPSSLVEKTLEWTVVQNQTAVDGPNRANPEGIGFYQFLNASIDVKPSLQRRIQTIDIQIDAAGEELFNYINVGQANTGITSAQVVPTYTNLSNGVGIFASRNRFLETDYILDNQTQTFLQTNELTKDLNFR